jgi:membrane fusion protein, multidrug efflux system
MNAEAPRATLPPAPTITNGERRAALNDLSEALSPRQTRKPSLKQAVLAMLIIVVGVALAKFSHDWWTVGRFLESTDDAYIGGNVTVISPEVAGFVSRLAVDDNQKVHAGDLLVKLDDRDYLAALARAEAAVAFQEATLTNLNATCHLQAAMIAQAQAGVAAANAEITRTHQDQIRYKKLADNGSEPIQSFEHADADYQEAFAAGQKSQAALEAAQQQLDVIQTQELQTRAALKEALAQESVAQLDLGYTELRAPVDGMVGNRSAQVGAYATAGSQLISLIPARGLWIDANFKEDQLAYIHPGSPATIRVDSIPGKTFRGHVISIAPATGAEFSVLPPENATGNFTKIVQRVTVRIVLNGEAEALGQLRPGLSATAKVDTRSTPDL